MHRSSRSSETTVSPESSVSVCPPPLHIQKLPILAQADHVARVVRSDNTYGDSRQSRRATIINAAEAPEDTRTEEHGVQEDICDGDISFFEGPSFLPDKHRIVSSDSIYSCGTFDIEKSTVVGLQDPLNSPFYNTPAMREQMVEKYRRLLQTHPAFEEEDDNVEEQSLPEPQRKSIYDAYAKKSSNVDEFEIIDEDETGSSPPPSPTDQNVSPSQRPGSATTTWNRVY